MTILDGHNRVSCRGRNTRKQGGRDAGIEVVGRRCCDGGHGRAPGSGTGPDRREEGLRARHPHHGRRRDDQGSAGRVGGLWPTERSQGQRHPRHPLLLRQQPRRRQVQRGGRAARLLGFDHRSGQGGRHGEVLCHLLRHPGEPRRQEPEGDHHRSGLDRSGHRQALWHDLSDRHDPGLRGGPEEAPGEPRHHQAACRDGRLDGFAPGLRVGGRLSRDGGSRHSGDRLGLGRRQPDCLAQHLGRTHQARSQLERR